MRVHLLNEKEYNHRGSKAKILQKKQQLKRQYENLFTINQN